jgi:hypothetical protein
MYIIMQYMPDICILLHPAAAVKKMSESQTKAGNQKKIKKFENLKNLKFLKI